MTILDIIQSQKNCELRIDSNSENLALFIDGGGVILESESTEKVGKFNPRLSVKKFPYLVDRIDLKNDGGFPRLVIDTSETLGVSGDNRWVLLLQLEDLSGICLYSSNSECKGRRFKNLNIPDVEVSASRDLKPDTIWLNLSLFGKDPKSDPYTTIKRGVLHNFYEYRLLSK